MTGVAHLSTGLLLKAKFPKAPLLWLLLAAEASDFVWVGLNLFHAGGETTLEATRARMPFETIGDLLLLEQPYSHSLVANLMLASFLAMLAYLAFRRSDSSLRAVAAPVFLAAFGHWLLDFLVHDADLALGPWSDATILGPALGLDAAAPGLGVNSTMPLLGWLIQTAVVIGCAGAFLRAYPAHRMRRWVFAGVVLLLCLTPAPLFLEGVGDDMMHTTTAVLLASLGEIAVITIVLYALVTRYTHPALRPTYGPYSGDLADLLRGYKMAAAGLALALAAAYLLQAALDAQTLRQVGVYSTVMAAVYLWLGYAMAGRSLSAWWLALLVPLLVGPLVRAWYGPGRLGLVHAGLEVLMALLALSSIRKMRTHQLML